MQSANKRHVARIANQIFSEQSAEYRRNTDFVTLYGSHYSADFDETTIVPVIRTVALVIFRKSVPNCRLDTRQAGFLDLSCAVLDSVAQARKVSRLDVSESVRCFSKAFSH